MKNGKTFVCFYESVNSPAVARLSEGFSINGYEVLRNDINGFKPVEAEKNADIVVLHGLRGKYRAAKEHYEANGVTVLVFDFGYLDRVQGMPDYNGKYWGLGFSTFGWCPEFDCPEDRFNKLKIKIDHSLRKPEKKIYICGQMPNDASHQMNEIVLKSYYEKLISNLKLSYGKEYKIIFRTHPRTNRSIPDNATLLDDGPLEEALLTAHCIVTHNSTVGIDAMRIGCPVMCDKSAYYRQYANDLYGDINNLKVPSEEEVKKYYCRLSYAQWTLDECLEGLPAKFLKEHNLIKAP